MGRVNNVMLLFALLAIVCPCRPVAADDPFFVRGSVYCDTCVCGFKTILSSHISGAVVRMECKDRKSVEVVYSKEDVTDSDGNYEIMIEDDHGDEICDVVLVSSSQTDCSIEDPGRNSARVPVTRENGLIGNVRFANALGYMKDHALSSCSQVLKQYQ